MSPYNTGLPTGKHAHCNRCYQLAQEAQRIAWKHEVDSYTAVDGDHAGFYNNPIKIFRMDPQPVPSVTVATYDDQPQEWVRAYCANLRFLGVQMKEAMRRFTNSWHDAQNRAAQKRERP